jgi:hypothetical protein
VVAVRLLGGIASRVLELLVAAIAGKVFLRCHAAASSRE